MAEYNASEAGLIGLAPARTQPYLHYIYNAIDPTGCYHASRTSNSRTPEDWIRMIFLISVAHYIVFTAWILFDYIFMSGFVLRLLIQRHYRAALRDGGLDVLSFLVESETLVDMWHSMKRICVIEGADFNFDVEMPPVGEIEVDLDSGIDE